MAASSGDYESIKVRLDEIVEAVSDSSLELDDALRLYEEAVSLGLAATELLGRDVSASSESLEKGEGSQLSDDAIDARIIN